jgi:LPS export ABC transporter protein LptC
MRLTRLSAARVIPLLLGMTLVFSCRNDIEKVNPLGNPDTLPSVQATNIEIIVSDSAFVRVRIKAPEIREFPVADSLEPKTEFPEGLVATFFDKSLNVESTLTAGYAIYHTKRKLFEASKNVVIRNMSQDQELHTELLWWDENNEKVWSDQPVTIITPNGTTYGDSGFESDQNFSRYSIHRSHGQLKVKENPADSTPTPKPKHAPTSHLKLEN